MSVLACRHVTKKFDSITALDGVDLDVAEGEIFGIVGPDGAGKSTLIRSAMGIVDPTEGEIELLDSPDRRKARFHAGYVPQRFSLYQDLSVLENIRFFGSLYGADQAEIDKRAEYMLKRTELWQFRDRYAGALSGGMKQKLALAAGLLHTPKVLFLDEPTTGVDPVSRREFWSMLYDFNKEGVTIIVSTPYMDEAELCKVIAFLDNGKILGVGTPAEMLTRYRFRVFEVETGEHKAKRILEATNGAKSVSLFGTRYHVAIDSDGHDETIAEEIKEAMRGAQMGEIEVRRIDPSLEDLFVSFVDDEPPK